MLLQQHSPLWGRQVKRLSGCSAVLEPPRERPLLPEGLPFVVACLVHLGGLPNEQGRAEDCQQLPNTVAGGLLSWPPLLPLVLMRPIE